MSATLWQSTDNRLLPLDAAGRFAAESFDPARRVEPGSLRGGWRPTGRGKPRRAAVDPMDRKVRNRTILLLTVLALVNAYVFMWREGSSLLALGLTAGERQDLINFLAAL